MPKLPFRKSEQPRKQPLDEGEKQQTQEEQLDLVIQEEEVTSDGEECELHVYERRYDTRGEKVYLRAGTKSKMTPPKRRSHRACLVLTRKYNSEGKFSYTVLEIQSRHIIEALRKVIGTYSGVDFTSEFVTLSEPPMCLFHYRDELRRHAESSDNHQLKSHMQLCLGYMEKALDQEIKIFKSHMSKKSISPELEHRHLWMVFKPGCLVYVKTNGIERLLRLRQIHDEEEDDSDEIESWTLYAEEITFSGSDIGPRWHTNQIMRYDGCRPVCELTVVPLHCHPEEERIRDNLLERGRKFLSLCGIHHCFYDGGARMCSSTSPDEHKTSHTNLRKVRHRIMIDPEEYGRNVQGCARNFIFGRRVYKSGPEAISELSDEEAMICDPNLPGYSLELKRWGLFLVVNVTEVAFNDTAFHRLVLPEKKKELFSSLLERQNYEPDDEFDDLIQGKGKGLIFLLYGPPGVGKTYTADEADVFMQKLTPHSLETNQLVSTLLRVLEYFEGILFLTTNRVETIDHAFKSRIHLAIAYPPLSADA